MNQDDVAPLRVPVADPECAARLRGLTPGRTPTLVADTLAEQLGELFYSRDPQARRAADGDARQAAFVAEALRGEAQGEWVYFPWSDRLVRYLPEALHTELRTARNRDLITADEQARLYDARIAVAGLSLGNAVATTIAVSGIGRELRLADFDELGGTNLNRIRTSVASIGLRKTELAAREIFEINPYARVELFHEGIRGDNIDAFLGGPEPVSALVDEVDNAVMKVQLRAEARRRRIPVVGALDLADTIFVAVERYDLEPELPLFGGRVPEALIDQIRPGSSPSLFIELCAHWFAAEFDARLSESVAAVMEGRLAGFPQLAATAFTAGSAVTCAVKRLLLGRTTASLVTRIDL